LLRCGDAEGGLVAGVDRAGGKPNGRRSLLNLSAFRLLITGRHHGQHLFDHLNCRWRMAHPS
ncbi:MAG: hypothetical protein ACE5G1_01095, partial [bacterium]